MDLSQTIARGILDPKASTCVASVRANALQKKFGNLHWVTGTGLQGAFPESARLEATVHLDAVVHWPPNFTSVMRGMNTVSGSCYLPKTLFYAAGGGTDTGCLRAESHSTSEGGAL